MENPYLLSLAMSRSFIFTLLPVAAKITIGYSLASLGNAKCLSKLESFRLRIMKGDSSLIFASLSITLFLSWSTIGANIVAVIVATIFFRATRVLVAVTIIRLFIACHKLAPRA